MRAVSPESCEFAAIHEPDTAPTLDWVVNVVRDSLLKSTAKGPESLKKTLPTALLVGFLEKATSLVKSEATLIRVIPQSAEYEVIVIGDTHGQFHDVCHMLELTGLPDTHRHLIFNGDFVDRGAWGIETLFLYMCLKLACPARVTLIRGNHESTACVELYGFKAEVFAKYGGEDGKAIYKACKKFFANLPLAALVSGNTLVLHGGLFRGPPEKRKRSKHSWSGNHSTTPKGPPKRLGTLKDLEEAYRGGQDPDGTGQTVVAADVLWSDPVAEPGLHFNDSRGIGMVFGPDITDRFLKENSLRLILRSHEGPDARDRRTDMHHMLDGWSLDHDVEGGKLMTVFSAPDYPQFQAGEERLGNKAAYAVLSPPDYATPQFKQFSAVLPRLEVASYYDYAWAPDSDEEYVAAVSCASDISGGCAGEDAEDPQSGTSSTSIEVSNVLDPACANVAKTPPQTADAAGLPPASASADIAADEQQPPAKRARRGGQYSSSAVQGHSS